ncbi:MAG: gliding motility lipoprotein GldD [Bacteroidales bacterium]|nr:gliding motility lipoprotein GldD [Bacteroidales bacterium]
MKQILLFVIIVCSLQACEERDIKIPKQRGYFRIDLPERNYQQFSEKGFPYSFQIPAYSRVEVDSDAGAEPYWINVQFPSLKATVHVSYRTLNGNLDKIVEDVHYLAFKHEVRADAINTKEFHYDEKHVHGLLFDIKGEAASVLQFCVTDSTKNFVRGALYFNVPPNKDSLAPVVEFIREDIIEMISSFEWKK